MGFQAGLVYIKLPETFGDIFVSYGLDELGAG